MMKKNIFIVGFMLIIIFSCKKENIDTPLPQKLNTCASVFNVTTSNNGDTLNAFFYISNSNKIEKVQNYDSHGVRNGYTVYSYDNNKIIETNYSSDGIVLGSNNEYLINDKGWVEKKMYTSTMPSSYDTIFFQYDVDGNNTYSIHKSTVGGMIYFDTIKYTYFSKNRVVIADIENGEPLYQHDYYFTSQIDNVGFNELSTFGDFSQKKVPSKGLYGNFGTNLIAKDIYTDYKRGNDYVATYAYEFDFNGNPSKVNSDLVATGFLNMSHSDVIYYKYVCK